MTRQYLWLKVVLRGHGVFAKTLSPEFQSKLRGKAFSTAVQLMKYSLSVETSFLSPLFLPLFFQMVVK